MPMHTMGQMHSKLSALLTEASAVMEDPKGKELLQEALGLVGGMGEGEEEMPPRTAEEELKSPEVFL